MPEHQPLIKKKSLNEGGKEDFIQDALKSECAANIDKLFKDRDKASVEKLKRETFEKVYETMGTELEASDLVRALVVRNEKFGGKLTVLFTILSLGLFLLIRPRDDDTILVMMKDGTVVKMKIERTPCCPTQPNAAFFMFLKYISLLFGILVMPNLIYLIATGKSVQQELHEMHIESWRDIPTLMRRNYPVTIFTIALFLFWLCSLLPHDYRDTHRRRHTVRELAVAQFTITGSSCRRRSNFRLFFGKYPSQLMLDLVGNLDVGRAAGTINPGDLSAFAGMNPSTIIMGFTIFLSFVTGVDTFFAWMDRSLALDHYAKEQQFCMNGANSPGRCNMNSCEDWVAHSHLDIPPKFCSAVAWTQSAKECAKYLLKAPCCGGCSKAGYQGLLDEGVVATLKSAVSLVADTGTILFTLLAAKFALSAATSTDNIDVLIKRRSRNNFKSEIANFENTIPLALDFMETCFARSRSLSLANRGGKRNADAVAGDAKEARKWSGIRNFQLDDSIGDWEAFFEDDLLSPPDTRWTSRLKVPRRCLGIGAEEEVLGAWVELPLLPPPISFFEFLTGGLWYALLPFGKTRHAVIITDQRLFYVRQRRPALPLRFLGTNLRIDSFRHDHDVVYGRMDRTKLSFANKMVHQNLLFERFIPGKVVMQTRFGALEIHRAHGDAVDVYHLISQLSRNSARFISKEEIEKTGVIWKRCQDEVAKSLTKQGAVWTLSPQPDDAVVPVPDFYLSDAAKEEMVFHLTFKDLDSQWSGTYCNTDVVVTTGRIYFWSRRAYKSFDCEALPCYCCCWMGCLNRFFAARNLPNSIAFFTLPSLLSFSTDLSVDPASWCVPHHTPLKVPCVERLCGVMTRCITGMGTGAQGSWSCLPRRAGASAVLSLLWRLKQSAHAEDDMVIMHRIKPNVLLESPEADVEDIFESLGFVLEEAENARHVILDHEQKIETLRKIMWVVQDACNKLSDKVDDLV